MLTARFCFDACRARTRTRVAFGSVAVVDIDVSIACRGAGTLLLRVYPDDRDHAQEILSSKLEPGDGEVDHARTPTGTLTRITFPSGERTIRHRARVSVTRGGRGADGTPPAPADLALELVPWTEPSRFCPSDELGALAASLVGGESRPETLRGIRDWVERNIEYRSGSSGPLATATDTLIGRVGVCRDFAHTCVALLRAVGVPARFAAVYAPAVDPPDFHAVAEAHDGLRWSMLDATAMSAPERTVRIATGLDAAQTAWAVTHGGVETDAPRVMVDMAED